MEFAIFITAMAILASVVLFSKKRRELEEREEQSRADQNEEDDDMTHMLMPSGGENDFKGILYQNDGIVEIDGQGNVTFALDKLNDNFNGRILFRSKFRDDILDESPEWVNIPILVKDGSGQGLSNMLYLSEAGEPGGQIETINYRIPAQVANKRLILQSYNQILPSAYLKITITAS